MLTGHTAPLVIRRLVAPWRSGRTGWRCSNRSHVGGRRCIGWADEQAAGADGSGQDNIRFDEWFVHGQEKRLLAVGGLQRTGGKLHTVYLGQLGGRRRGVVRDPCQVTNVVVTGRHFRVQVI